MPYGGLNERAQERLAATAEAVRALQPELSTFDITPEHLAFEGAARPLLDEIKSRCGTKHSLYVIRLGGSDAESVILDELQDRFANAKNREVDLAFAQRNMVPPSPILYVGSSLNLSARTRQHLGFGPAKTYALRLNRWLRECSLELVVATFDSHASRRAVLYLEDTLWHNLTPMFGRAGSTR